MAMKAWWTRTSICWLSEDDMRDENEKRIFKAIKENDVETLKEILKTPSGCRLGSNELTVLSVAVFRGGLDVVKYLIDNGCDVREVEEKSSGNTVFHLLISEYAECNVVYDEKSKLDTIEILLSNCSNAVEVIFYDINEKKMTPFLLACASVRDAIILRFLALLGENSIPMDRCIGYKGNNIFHFLLSNSEFYMPLPRAGTVQALIDKIPHPDQLLDAKNDDGATSLHHLLLYNPFKDWREAVDLAKIFLKHGASPDIRNQRGRPCLHAAILLGNVWFVETLLRAGCSTDYTYENMSPLSYVLKNEWLKPQATRVNIVELFLAFGYDLQKELFLYTIDERPIEFTSPEYAEFRDTTGMNPNILEALRKIRQSNKTLSLQRQCRNTIRRHLKYKADEVIGSLTCIPDRIKSFLLVENETPLLEILE